MTVTRDEWLAGFAAELGVPQPTDQEIEALLSLAGTAAHGSERTAAPLSCWLVGRAGLEPAAAQVAAERLAAYLDEG
ncbi:MAG TPA: DUF6457 domain-containing protein [Acidimicrobiales bacterium]|jgi:hypothetical protein|nr:DUF6457 domain-containing protein [Acidimicrobiales bacterium]HWF22742.1 DUF6457 domain-containing protein [Acidimicrobiales bacterium]